MIMAGHKGPLRPTDEEGSRGSLGPPRSPGIRQCPPRPGLPVDIREAQAGGARSRAPSGRHHNEPQVFVTLAAAAPPGKTQGLECLFSSETFAFAHGLTELSGPGSRFPDEAPRPPGGLGRHLPQPALLRRGLGPRRGARRGWPGQAASRAPGSVKARPASPPAGSRTTEDPARLGRKGGAARSPSHSKATRKRDLGSAQWAHGVQDGDPQPSPAAPRWPHPLPSTHSAAGLLPRREGPGNPARRRRRHWCVTGAPTPGTARP